MFHIKIVTKIALLVGVIAATTGIVAAYMVHNGAVEIIFKQALDRLEYETNIISLRLSSDIETLRQDSLYLVGTPPIQGIPRALANNGKDPLDNSSVKDWENRLATLFAELIRAKPNYLQVSLLSFKENGKEIVRVERRGTQITALSEKQLQTQNENAYYQNTLSLQPGELYLSDITLQRKQDKIVIPHQPILRVAAPVFFNNELFGIIVINMSFRDIFTHIIESTPRVLIPYVTNEKGYFLAHPNSNYTFGFDLNHEHKIMDVFSALKHIQYTDIRDKQFIFYQNNDDDKLVLNVVKLAFDPQNPARFLAVGLSTSHQQLLSEANALRDQSLIITCLFVAASLIIGSILSRRLVKPILTMSTAAEAMAEGKTVAAIKTSANDEIGQLARSFNYMQSQLEEKEKALLENQAKAMYATKMAALGEMAGGMAHEINNPIMEINLIAARVKRYLKKQQTDDIPQAMDDISAAVNRVSKIIDSLRKVSRDSEDDLFELVTLGDLLNDILGVSIDRYQLKGIKLKIDYQGVNEQSVIECQRLQIGQILINLLNNAYDAVVDQPVKWIHIDLLDADHNLEIVISDSGAGIEKKVRERIFEPLYTTKDIGKGTGLGLSVSLGIAEKHKGTILIDENAPHTRFILRLPKKH